MATVAAAAPAPGEIRPVLYTLPEIKRRSGLGAWAFRTARRHGLAVRYMGGRGYILGRDFIEFVTTSARSTVLPESNGE